MKTTQAWLWLTAGVLAAGMNAVYHDGGAQWAHDIVDRVSDRVASRVEDPVEDRVEANIVDRVIDRSQELLARATDHADLALSQARLTVSDEGHSPCRFRESTSSWKTGLARSQSTVDRIKSLSARQKAQIARVEAKRVRVEAAISRVSVETPVIAQNFKFAFAPACPRIHVNVPRVRVATPEIHIETSSTDPI
jgi:hypothetical protein